jgi:regulator of sigma E protease
VLFAGVTMNYILAGVLFSMALYVGMPTYATDQEILAGKPTNVQIGEISNDSPAQKAGLKMGDIILGFKENGQFKETKLVKDVQEYTALRGGSSVVMVLRRGKNTLDTEVFVRKDPPTGQGAIGIILSDSKIISFSFFRSFAEGFKYLVLMTGEFLSKFSEFLLNLVMLRDTGGQIGGPVKIAQMTADVVPLGLAYIFNFAAILSLTLAIINALPFPALDGGRALFLLIEKIKGSPIKQKTEAMVHTVGFAMLIVLMIALTFNDVVSLFKGWG